MVNPASIIDGDRALPGGYDHPHASEQARRIAERGTILRAQVGSGVHGTSIIGQDDRDEMGICLEPPEFVTGIARVPAGLDAENSTVDFQQYQRHTVWDEPGGLANRSGAGDLDVVIYSARKWARLALSGNPTVLLLLLCPTMRSSTGMRPALNSWTTLTDSFRDWLQNDSWATWPHNVRP